MHGVLEHQKLSMRRLVHFSSASWIERSGKKNKKIGQDNKNDALRHKAESRSVKGNDEENIKEK